MVPDPAMLRGLKGVQPMGKADVIALVVQFDILAEEDDARQGSLTSLEGLHRVQKRRLAPGPDVFFAVFQVPIVRVE